MTHPALTATAFKRYMGTNRITRLGAREFLPEELSALVLASLKVDAEASPWRAGEGRDHNRPGLFQ